MGFQLAELDAGLRFSPVEVYVLDDLDRVLPGAPLVLHISDDGACLALLERVLEPGAASPEDAQYIAWSSRDITPRTVNTALSEPSSRISSPSLPRTMVRWILRATDM